MSRRAKHRATRQVISPRDWPLAYHLKVQPLKRQKALALKMWLRKWLP